MPPPVEISIPSTSTLYQDSKPYTSYNITLRLPLRSFVVQKRYSEFEQLHRTLISLVGSPPPATLPSKSWFRSTVSSPELTERRRAELEQQQMEEQNEDVEVLSRIVKRQKEMSLAIWDEVETQTHMLDQLGDDVDRRRCSETKEEAGEEEEALGGRATSRLDYFPVFLFHRTATLLVRTVILAAEIVVVLSWISRMTWRGFVWCVDIWLLVLRRVTTDD
ncbi:V-SNARE [Magnaporthiopsis poae ATCC 64411]|uniref:V-SNARE n=1 Tax=Magnaporthiopsis poae (strain ATCC 64411 / 73-15) TaxID=644358 RepID=A0A0C4DXF1_MAGP6|nr:V-SNARE [Magnaporthiopsis poae ATCC 64411]